MKQRMFKISVMICSLIFFVQLVDARAFCALRDPVSSIKHLFPESSNHQSVVRAINSEMREQISQYLPFTLHFNELGKHTLYIAQLNKEDIGYVHVRSELTQWGIVELAWALNPDLTIRNVNFQRCRIPGCEDKYLIDVLDATAGKSYNELLSLINSDGTQLKDNITGKYKDTSPIVLAAIKSALKTISVTSITWKNEISKISQHKLLQQYFPETKQFSFIPITISSERVSSLDLKLGGSGSMIVRDSIQAFQVKSGNMDKGIIVSASLNDASYHGILNLLFDSNGQVLSINSIPEWPNDEVSQAFKELQGEKFIDAEDCNTAAQLVGFELYFLTRKQQ